MLDTYCGIKSSEGLELIRGVDISKGRLTRSGSAFFTDITSDGCRLQIREFDINLPNEYYEHIGNFPT